MKEFITQNRGKRVVINVASMQDVMALKRELLKTLQNKDLGIEITGSTKELLDRDIKLEGIIGFIKDTLISMDISEGLEEVVYKCLASCTYNTGYVINKELFDSIDMDAREDYYEIVVECILENLRPFMKSLISTLKTVLPKLSNSQILSVMQNKTNI